MKIIILLFTISLMVTSCDSQTDLETLEFDKSIPENIKKIKEIEKDDNGAYGLKSYRSTQLDYFRFGEVFFSKYAVPNGYDDAYSDIYIHVDNFEKNNYLGFTVYVTNDKEGEDLLNYLKKRFGKPEERTTGLENGSALVWELKESKQWVLLEQNTENTRDHKKYLNTEFTIVKQGTRMLNSNNPEWLTVLENFKARSTPKDK
ncbi:hypothetical protein [Flavobacterium nitrogenifigens]|uniref:Lipoprotein n=1 Tax=Flavobacterium nitrogenifigens TaxID=1617283 RepID=A0A521D0N1_9FLAO|nr:hypothetical protein [Flavobacterium nitrogenifigens]KAF2332804.1 hypothetical protein DM397_10855 [Flavobacterium nitrogenifigens]SMO65234.1 hypothetical protein SAMN06265220_102868 [Flavobacterium nitrogenifigens]